MLVGLTVLRNGTMMGYPWVESILSVMDYVDHFHVGEGHSTDGTLDVLERLKDKYGDRFSVSRFEWPQMDTGFAIGAATNDALRYVRHLGGKILYVQADELWHPDSAAEMRLLAEEDYDAYVVPFLHLEYNCQIVQEGAGYERAVRMVDNDPDIVAHRDAWTFEGYKKPLAVHSLPHPLVHCNYCFWHNIPVKKRTQADELYRDLPHYAAAASQAEVFHSSGRLQLPEMFLEKTSPFEEHLPPVFLSMIGETRYYVREELLECE
jgi:glycosyltransferase involved in cell wall biosynthesis